MTLASAPATGDPGPVADGITFIGTATVLIRYGGLTILTDPNFLHAGETAHLGYGLRSKRRTDPAIPIGQLPPIDFVVLSHLHGDHFDQVAERQLARDLPIITTPQGAAGLRAKGFHAAIGLPTWESHAQTTGANTRVRVTALPGRHGPPVVARLLPSVMGSLLELTRDDRPPLRIYISGDTLVFDGLREIARRVPQIDIALLHLGGTRIMGLLLTMDADQGVEAMRIVRPEVAVPIHYDDYPVFRSPLSDFRAAVSRAGLDAAVRFIARGETLAVP
jgi:L-ascorbate metabolism protein UlaG (beta-lactamase superfamily)